MKGLERLVKARTRLLREHTWFGELGMRLTLIADASIGSLCTDGTVIRYNPPYVLSLSEAHLLFGLAHEVLHCALGHMWRVGGRCWDLANEAADYVVNLLLIEAGFTPPPGILIDWRFKGLTFDQVYAILENERQQNKQGKGQGKGNGDGVGGFTKPQEDGGQDDGGKPGQGKGQGKGQGQAPAPLSEVDWAIAAEQASMRQRGAGTMPGELDRVIRQSRERRIPWAEELREFIGGNVPADYSWSRPNRRYVPHGMYLPGMTKAGMPRIGGAMDVSGSCGPEELGIAGGELTSLLVECQPECLELAYHDHILQRVQEIIPGEVVELQSKGGGGTAFAPVLDHFNQNPPCCLVWFTDLDGPIPLEVPSYPVLWITPEGVTRTAPWGRTIRLSK